MKRRLLELLHLVVSDLLRAHVELLFHTVDFFSQALHCFLIGHTQDSLEMLATLLMVAQVAFNYWSFAAHTIPECLLGNFRIIALIIALLWMMLIANSKSGNGDVLIVFAHVDLKLLLNDHLESSPYFLLSSGTVGLLDFELVEQVVE